MDGALSAVAVEEFVAERLGAFVVITSSTCMEVEVVSVPVT